jgi:hypothetical protein
LPFYHPVFKPFSYFPPFLSHTQEKERAKYDLKVKTFLFLSGNPGNLLHLGNANIGPPRIRFNNPKDPLSNNLDSKIY